MQYRPGAFIPGVAVQPVLVRYSLDEKADTVTWTWDQTHGAIACILLTLTQWSTEVSLYFVLGHFFLHVFSAIFPCLQTPRLHPVIHQGVNPVPSPLSALARRERQPSTVCRQRQTGADKNIF